MSFTGKMTLFFDFNITEAASQSNKVEATYFDKPSLFTTIIC